MLNDLLLLSGNDIPFIEAQITIHQPIIKEIAYIGEEAFFSGCNLLNFSKDSLSTEDKIHLENKSNFEVFMSIMNDKNQSLKKMKINAMMVLALMFPEYKINVVPNGIVLFKEKENTPHIINENNFNAFQSIVVDMFCLNRKSKDEITYNPQGAKAQEIYEKIMRGRRKVAELKGQDRIAVLSRYISILAVGSQKDINSLLQYTVYQLFDEFERFNLKENYEQWLQLKIAGAKDLDNVEHWMKDIHAIPK